MFHPTPVRVLLLSAVLLFLSAFALAQFGASIEGTVTDNSGAVVSGANVTVTDQATGVGRNTVTSSAGFYRVSGLTPGAYTVDVAAGSFKKETTRDVRVDAETTRGVNVVLTPGPSQESVTVTAAPSVLQTENANVEGSITSQQVEELPTFGRDPYELLRLAPGVFGDGARGSNATAAFLPNTVGVGGSANSIYQVENQPQISANGQRVTENNFMIDGVDVNSLTNAGAAVVSPTQESVAEITVVSGSYSAEDGRNSGAQIKVISKTGTNAIHGTGFFKYDEPGLNAFNTFGGFAGNFTRAPNVRIDNKLRNYGGGIGGPIIKNKLFFFFAYEGEHAFNQTFGNNYVETPQFIAAVKAANPNSIAAQILSAPGTTPRIVSVLTPSCADVSRPALDANGNPTCQVVAGGLDLGSPYPAGSGPGNPYLRLFSFCPTLPPPGTCPPNVPEAYLPGAFVGGGLDGIPDVELAQMSYPNPRVGSQYNARVDWTINSKHTFSASTYLTNSTSTNPPGTNQTSAPSREVINKPFSPAGTILWNWVVSPTKLNEVRLNFSRFAYNEIDSNRGIVNWGIPDAEIQDVFKNGQRIWFGAPQGENTPGILAQNTYGFGDTFSWSLSKHSLKFGFQYRKEQNNNNEVGFARPLYTFSQMWNFANDAPIFEQNAVNPNTGNPDSAQRYFRTSYYGGFVQDDWKFRSNLTLNIGLRYEYYSPVSEPQGLLSNLALAGSGPNAIADATVITGKTVYSTPKTNFAPRIGFAWSPDKYDRKVVFRGGFGMYYDGVPEADFDPARENPPFHAFEANCCGTSGLEGFGGPYDPTCGSASNMPCIVYALGSSDSPLSYPGNPALGGGIGSNGLPKNCCVQFYFEPQHFRIPYVYGYSLETQMELPAKMIFTLGYQGSSSHDLIRIFDGNQVYDTPPGSTAPVSPGYYIKPDVHANYNSLNARLEHRFSKGVQAAFKYRYSKSLDEVSFGQPDSSVNETYPRDLRSEYGPSDFDVTHFAVLSGIWDLPIFRNRHDGVGKILGGWQLSGIFTIHSGFPWTPINNNCYQTPGNQFICPIRPEGYSGGAGTDYSNDTFLRPNGNFPNGGPSYFTLLPNGPPGVGRNSFRGPRYRAVDMTFGKNTPLPFLGEGGLLQVRMNVFNVFNNLNLSPFTFNTDSTVVQDQFFGTAGNTPALAGRVVELQARISF